MNFTPAERIARTVLYEGYILYPYRPSSVKNRQRWTFGGVYPRAYIEANEDAGTWSVQTECLVEGGAHTVLGARAGFLHLCERLVGTRRPASSDASLDPQATFSSLPVLHVGDQTHHSWQEAVEREASVVNVALMELLAEARVMAFDFPAYCEVETIRDEQGQEAGATLRRQWPIAGTMTLSATRIENSVFRVRVRVHNRTPLEDATVGANDALLRSFVSAHVLLAVERGAFLSAIDPPARYQVASAGCQNLGLWPVLVHGGMGQRGNLVLSAPIILPDFPQIAPQSPGDLFDGTEIDEILTLRIMTMTEGEKREMCSADARARELLQRTEALTAEQLRQLHGTMRRLPPAPAPDSVELQPGGRVRLRPRRRADAFDLILRGKAATIASVEHDYEGQVYVTVTIDDDPGKDLGLEGKPGHRFFFHADEVESLESGSRS